MLLCVLLAFGLFVSAASAQQFTVTVNITNQTSWALITQYDGGQWVTQAGSRRTISVPVYEPGVWCMTHGNFFMGQAYGTNTFDAAFEIFDVKATVNGNDCWNDGDISYCSLLVDEHYHN